MTRVAGYTLITVICLLAGAWTATGQKYPERGDIRKGNRAYEKGRFEESETQYMRAAEKNPESFEARYNLGNALYRQGKWEGAESVFSRAAEVAADERGRFDSHYNTGNAMFQQRKLQEALEEYKQALRLDPNDMEAKFNLAYVKKLLEDQEGGGDGDGDDDNNDNQDNDDNQGGGGGGDDPDQGDPDQDGDNDDQNGAQQPDRGDDGDGQPQQRPPGMSREEAENLLDAMQGNEDRAREKADERKAGTVERSDKNW
ncbi:MAG: tetratricopeptide repeat protein [Alistipes sp.]|nr:tetratricopeptide repeat protein [Alistipes sp.]